MITLDLKFYFELAHFKVFHGCTMEQNYCTNIDSLIVHIYKVIKVSSFELFPKEIPADRNSWSNAILLFSKRFHSSIVGYPRNVFFKVLVLGWPELFIIRSTMDRLTFVNISFIHPKRTGDVTSVLQCYSFWVY